MVLPLLLAPRCAEAALRSSTHKRLSVVCVCFLAGIGNGASDAWCAPGQLVDAAGVPSNVGLLQVQSGDGSLGSVYGINLEATDVVIMPAARHCITN